MELNEILKQVNTIFIELFDDKSIVLNEQSDTSTIEAWDSLNHIQVITAVEKRFKVRFDLNDLLNFQNIGDLCRGVQSKLG
ncbi:MAG: acyl carrier protein [Bacteroidales bacterium]|nr:acyl carrier protein [Bacteroidales bacterium]